MLGFEKYKDHAGIEHIALSASTSSQSDFYLTGRDATGVLSIAIFRKEGNKWKLEHFEPAIGSYGRWGMASLPDTIILSSNNIGFFESNFTDGPGSPQFYQDHIIGFVNGRLKELLSLDNSDVQSQTCTEWGSGITFIDTLPGKPFRDFILKTAGTLCASDTEDYDPKILPAQIANALVGKDSVQFQFQRKYQFQNDHYQMKDEKINFIKSY